ncbi:hypothetical protein [Butyrivibrio proteoclasticus]|uniref:hypothetical protein n=1 Tax=Butyrivibrio proteoclasticus TaxID=43305 RepID=UPI00047894F2|nr:hypothetical protein [Butyrivibrio proteoclasticus]
MSMLKLAICDSEEVYCRRLDEYLRNNLGLSFDIYSFTGVDLLNDFARDNEIALLLSSEKEFLTLQKNGVKDICSNIIVLDEQQRSVVCEDSCDEGMLVEHVSKYQPAKGIVDEILSFCTKAPKGFEGLGNYQTHANGRLIGFYTPHKGAGQTTLARKVAQRLSERGKTIFLSLESFSALTFALGGESKENLSDLLYYADCERDKFCLYLERIKTNVEGVDFIAPAKTASQIKEIDHTRFKNLYDLIVSEGGYNYVVLDMTDYPEGFLDILRMCDDVITITRNGEADNFVLGMYEDVLRENSYEDVYLKTFKCQVPDQRESSRYNSVVDSIINREEPLDESKG